MRSGKEPGTGAQYESFNLIPTFMASLTSNIVSCCATQGSSLDPEAQHFSATRNSAIAITIIEKVSRRANG